MINLEKRRIVVTYIKTIKGKDIKKRKILIAKKDCVVGYWKKGQWFADIRSGWRNCILLKNNKIHILRNKSKYNPITIISVKIIDLV